MPNKIKPRQQTEESIIRKTNLLSKRINPQLTGWKGKITVSRILKREGIPRNGRIIHKREKREELGEDLEEKDNQFLEREIGKVLKTRELAKLGNRKS